MAHEPKLTVHSLKLKPLNKDIQNTNRELFKHLTNQAGASDVPDTVLFMDVFKLFVSRLDTPDMFKDEKSKKTMTAYQANIEDKDEDANLKPDTGKFIIHGKIEGGSFGRKRNKTEMEDKTKKTPVRANDAITYEFYFLIYMPPASNKSVLIIQSFTDETIDNVVKLFWTNFLKHDTAFDKPVIKKFVPPSIASDFKKHTVVSRLDYSTTVTGASLLGDAIQTEDKDFKVTITIEPVGDMTTNAFEALKQKVANNKFGGKLLGNYKTRKGTLKDTTTNKTSPFELESDYEVQPTIFLSKYINLNLDEINYALIEEYCLNLLEVEVKPHVYPEYDLQEH